MVPAIFASLPSAKVGADYKQEERPIQAIRKIVVKGSVDVYFRRFPTAHMMVAGETQEAIDAIKTRIKGDKLIIENEGIGGVHVTGSNNQFATGHGSIQIGKITIGGARGGVHFGANVDHGRAVVGVALPEIQSVKIKGSGDITLLDLQQAGIELEIEGSGDITASGLVDSLEVSIAGSGDVDCSGLIANRADLSVVGSGDIEALVRQSVAARVAGSGDIVVRGSPPERSKQVAGSGSVKFK